MGKVKRLELWWQLYRTSLPVWDLENFRPMDFCWHECTCSTGLCGMHRLECSSIWIFLLASAAGDVAHSFIPNANNVSEPHLLLPSGSAGILLLSRVKGPIHCKLNCAVLLCKKTARKTELNVCGIPWVNCAVLYVKDDWKGQLWGPRYCLSKLRSLLSFSVGYDVTQ